MCLCEEWYNFSLGCFKHNDTVKYLSNVCNSCFDCPTFYPLDYYGVDIIVNSMHGNPFHTTTTHDFPYQETPLQVSLDVWPAPAAYNCGLKPYSYHWSTNSQTYIIEDSTISNPTFSFLGNVSIYLKVTDKLGAVTYDTAHLIMQTLGGIDSGEIDSSKQIRIFPNPANTSITINAPFQIESVEIIDFLGKIVLQQKVNSDKTVTIDVLNLNSGLFTVKVKTKDFIKEYKFVKE
jgi:hypothetical protein